MEVALRYPDQVIKILCWAFNSTHTDTLLNIVYENSENESSNILESGLPRNTEQDKLKSVELFLLLGCVLEWTTTPHRNIKNTNVLYVNG